MNKCFSLALMSFLSLASGCQKKPPADKHIRVVMRKYSIEPSLIQVKAGKRVVLEVTTSDVQHGLDIPDLGIKEPVQPGRPTIVSFTAPAKGEYRIACGVICGPRHEDMSAKLVVE